MVTPVGASQETPETEAVETEVDRSDQPDTSILDELTGSKDPGTERPSRADEGPAGGSDDA